MTMKQITTEPLGKLLHVFGMRASRLQKSLQGNGAGGDSRWGRYARGYIILLLLCFAALAVAEDASLSARDRAKQQLALRASAQKIVNIIEAPTEFGEKEFRRISAELGSRMQQDIKAHAEPDASRKLCTGILSERYRQAIERQIDSVIKQAGETSALPISREDVLRQVGAEWEDQAKTAADLFAKKHITATFKKARKQSVALQRDELKDRIKMPAEDDLNGRLTEIAETSGHHPPRLGDLNSMTEWLASFAEGDNKPLYKEVQNSNREVSERIMQRVKKQYGSQLTAITISSQNLPHKAIDSETIQVALRDSVDLSIKKVKLEKTGSGATIYNPFDVIYAEVERKADAMQEERLAVAIHEQKNMPISRSAVESVLRDNIKEHVLVKKSRHRLVTHYASETKSWIIKDLASRAGRVGDAQFNSKLDSLLKQNKRLAKAVNDNIGSSLDSVLPDIRGKITKEQLQKVFGDADIEVLSPEAVLAVWEAGYGDPAKNSDQAWAALQSAGLISDRAKKDQLLEETLRQMVDISNRLIPVACTAMREQANMLSVLEKEWTPRLRKDVENNRAVDEIISDWTAELKSRWSVYAEKQKSPYTDLFDRTLDMLEKSVRKLYESIEAKLAEAEETPSEPTPEEQQPVEEPPPPEETPEDVAETTIEKMLETLDFVLYFRDTSDGGSEAVLLDGNGSSTRLIFDPSDVKFAVDEVYKTLIPAIESTAGNKAKKSPKRKGIIALITRDRTLDLKIAVLIGSQQVRHMMSILLRNRVELFVKDWNANPANSELELEWEDNLEIAQ